MAASPATASRSLRSAGTTTALRPRASTCAATASSCSFVRDDSTTWAPASASARRRRHRCAGAGDDGDLVVDAEAVLDRGHARSYSANLTGPLMTCVTTRAIPD